MKTVSALNLRVLLRVAAHHGISADTVLGELAVKDEILLGRRTRYPWPDYVEALDRSAVALGGYDPLTWFPKEPSCLDCSPHATPVLSLLQQQLLGRVDEQTKWIGPLRAAREVEEVARHLGGKGFEHDL